MAFIHDTYQQILKNNIDEVQYNLLNGQVPLANSNIRIQTQVLSKTQYLQYMYLDGVSLQCTPSTATDEYLDNWGILKNVTRKSASYATGVVIFTGSSGASIPAGTVLVAQNGETYTTDTLVDVGQNVGITAVNIGSEGNQDANTILTLRSSIAGVDSSIVLQNAMGTGSEQEEDDQYRIRVLQAYATQATGDSRQEHINWALAIDGVTQAWVPAVPLSGTECVIYVMLDRTNSTLGYPQGTDGSATSETRYAPATGDQLTIANRLFEDKPYTEIQIICSPERVNIDFEIDGLASATASTQQAVKNAVQTLLHTDGTPLGTNITLASISSAISGVSGTTAFTIVAPSADIKLGNGQLPEIGNLTFGA